MIKRLILKWQEWIVIKTFQREFKVFHYPFESIDSLVNRLSYDERYAHMTDIQKFYNSKAFEREITELKKLFYKELSIKSETDIERAGYRLCLVFIRQLEKRFNYVSNQVALEDRKSRVQTKFK